MAAGNTYTPIATTTLGSAVASYTFSSIPGTYTDLVLVIALPGSGTGTPSCSLTLNGDTANNYGRVHLLGNGATATSTSGATQGVVYLSYTAYATAVAKTWICSLNNYSNTTTKKAILTRESDATNNVSLSINSWNATPAAITTILVSAATYNFAIGSTFSLYGILAA